MQFRSEKEFNFLQKLFEICKFFKRVNTRIKSTLIILLRSKKHGFLCVTIAKPKYTITIGRFLIQNVLRYSSLQASNTLSYMPCTCDGEHEQKNYVKRLKDMQFQNYGYTKCNVATITRRSWPGK